MLHFLESIPSTDNSETKKFAGHLNNPRPQKFGYLEIEISNVCIFHIKHRIDKVRHFLESIRSTDNPGTKKFVGHLNNPQPQKID